MNRRLNQHLLDDRTSHIRQAELATHVLIRKSSVVHAKTVQDRRLQVMDVDRIFSHLEAKIVRSADSDARLNPAAREPHRIRLWMMVASGVVRIAAV